MALVDDAPAERRPGCTVDSKTFADHLNEDDSQRFCRIL
jgi:hypothetical protein